MNSTSPSKKTSNKHLLRAAVSLPASAVTLAATVFTSAAFAEAPTVNGNVISWTDPGWFQVQNMRTFESLCEGGRSCTVEEGKYIVINHTTGERFSYVTVRGNSSNSGQNSDQNSNESNNADNGANVQAPPVTIATTGQMTSYAFGDDGDYRSGVLFPGQRFTSNNNGTFTDAQTGITWLSIRECISKRDWSGSVDFANNLSANSDLCPQLNDGSEVGDWRLPNIKELYSLSDLSTNSPAFSPGIPYDGERFGTPLQSPWEFYWSSSSFEVGPDILGWAYDAGFGEVDVVAKENAEWAWAVRND